jgi:hypothetical protein
MRIEKQEQDNQIKRTNPRLLEKATSPIHVGTPAVSPSTRHGLVSLGTRLNWGCSNFNRPTILEQNERNHIPSQ